MFSSNLTKGSPSLPSATTIVRTPSSSQNPRIYALTFIACLGSWMFGYNNGVIAGVLVLPSFFTSFNLPPIGSTHYNTVTSNVVSLFQIGGLVGSGAVFWCMRNKGRRWGLGIAAGVYTIGAALQTFSGGRSDCMYVGRLVTGLGTGGVTVVLPLYIAEISPPSIRGSLVGIYEINNQLSSLVGYWCNYIVNQYIPASSPRQWQIPLGMQIIPSSLLLLASLFILPESPRFLAKIGKREQARKVLAWIRKLSTEDEYVTAEMNEIEEAIQRQERPTALHPTSTSNFGLVKELWWPGNRNRVLIGLGLMVGQNLTGIGGVNFYTPAIFKSIGFDGTRVVLLASGMYAVVKTLATLLSLGFLIDRFGRRKLLLLSSIGTSLALWYIGAFVTAAHVDITKPQPKSTSGWIAIVCVYIFAAFFSLAWSGVVWVYCAEIYPTRIKDLAVCLTTATQWLSQFAVARASPDMLSSWKGGFFFFFAGCIGVMGLLVWWLVPETKGRTLESMDAVFGSAYEVRDRVRDSEEG